MWLLCEYLRVYEQTFIRIFCQQSTVDSQQTFLIPKPVGLSFPLTVLSCQLLNSKEFRLIIKSIDLFDNDREVLFEVLDFAFEFLYHFVAFLRRTIEETNIVFVSRNLLFEQFVLAHEFGAVAFEVKFLIATTRTKFALFFVENLLILFVNFIFFFVRYVTYSEICVRQTANSRVVLFIVACEFVSLEGFDSFEFEAKIFLFFNLFVFEISLFASKEVVACSDEAFPNSVAILFSSRTYSFPLFLESDEFVGSRTPFFAIFKLFCLLYENTFFL